jgi:hypothetical protein
MQLSNSLFKPSRTLTLPLYTTAIELSRLVRGEWWSADLLADHVYDLFRDTGGSYVREVFSPAPTTHRPQNY